VPIRPNLPGAGEQWWDWQSKAACRGQGTALFFSNVEEPRPARRRREQQAKMICERCPVIDRCRDHALRFAEPYGVWGGMSALERIAAARNSDSPGERRRTAAVS
jgi:WhiB family transcriptional regulator, redox-sensing transcriptional regulator